MKYIIILIASLIGFSSPAQETTNKAIITVKYLYSVNQNPNDITNFFKENMILMIAKNASLFKSYDMLLSDSTMRVQGLAFLASGKNKGKISDEILNYYDPTKTDLISKTLASKFFFERNLPTYDWQFTNDTATILGYKCKTARTFSPILKKFFTAWFAPELPFQAGPNSFWGLPGVILKVESEDKRYSSVAYAISKPTLLTESIAFDKDAQKTTEVEFNKLNEAIKKNPDLFFQQMKGTVSKPVVN